MKVRICATFFCLLFAVILVTQTAAFEKLSDSSKDCASCHTLTKEEASKLLKAKVLEVRNAAVGGLWELEGTHEGKKFIVFMDYQKKHLILVNRIVPVDKIGAPPELKKLDLSKIPLGNAVIMGNPDAKIKVIVFDDVDCPYCKKLHVEIKKVLETRKDVAFYIKLYPLVNLHPAAYEKSKAIQCEKSADLLDDAFAGKPVKKPTCETDEVDKNINLGKSLGISGTPAIIFPDGRFLPGFVDAGTLLQLLENYE